MRFIAATIFFVLMCSALAADFDPSRFEKEVIVPACNDPMQLEVLADGRVFFTERNGSLKLVEPQSKRVVLLGQRAVHVTGEIGLLGLALDRDFAKSQALFLFFSPKEKEGTLRLSRFALKDGKPTNASPAVVASARRSVIRGATGRTRTSAASWSKASAGR
jgi:glucose/arabinose dehydrogenase